MRGKPRLIQLTDENGDLKSPNWYIHYYAGGRSRRTSTGHRIGEEDHEAHVALASFIVERERPPPKQLDTLSLAQALENYYEEHGQFLTSADTARDHERRLKRYFPGHTVAHLTPAAIRGYVRECEAEGRSAGTTRRELAHLAAALNHEVAEQRLVYAPKIVLPPPAAPRERILSPKEISRLLRSCCAPHVRHFVEIMLETGQRPGSVEQLQWEQVDFRERMIHFGRNGKRQTNKRVRSVPISKALYRLLKRLHGGRGPTGFVLEYVVVTKEGERIVRPAGCVRHAFTRALQRANIKNASRYTLRHTFGDGLDRSGVDDRTISELMGHTNVLTTRRHYLKANMARLRKAVESAQKVRKTKAR